MKQVKVLLSALLFVIIGVLISTSILNNSNKKVSADPISYYYSSIDTTQPSYISIIVYVWDAVDLIDDTTTISLYGFNGVYEYVLIDSRNAQFVRDLSYDPSYSDYKAYRYSWNYSNISSQYTALYLTFNWSNLAVDSIDIPLTGVFACPYDPTYKEYWQQGYDEGYDDGYDEGYDVAEEETTQYYQTYYSQGGDGYSNIYNSGYRRGQDSLDTMSWFSSVSSGVEDIINIKLFPSITIGALIFIPLMFMILKGILWIWRRN